MLASFFRFKMMMSLVGEGRGRAPAPRMPRRAKVECGDAGLVRKQKVKRCSSSSRLIFWYPYVGQCVGVIWGRAVVPYVWGWPLLVLYCWRVTRTRNPNGRLTNLVLVHSSVLIAQFARSFFCRSGGAAPSNSWSWWRCQAAGSINFNLKKYKLFLLQLSV